MNSIRPVTCLTVLAVISACSHTLHAQLTSDTPSASRREGTVSSATGRQAAGQDFQTLTTIPAPAAATSQSLPSLVTLTQLESPTTTDPSTSADTPITTDSPSADKTSGPSSPQTTTIPARLPASFTSRNHSAKTAEIRRKLDRLRLLLEASATALKKAEANVAKPGAADPGSTEVKITPLVPFPSTRQNGESDTAADVSETLPADTAAQGSQSDQPRIIMTSPVNRLRLADSLFGAGKTDAALQAYQSLDLDQLDEIDQVWIQFQIANCHRRLGDIRQAEKYYRIVASYKIVDVAVETSRWWLDRLHAKHELHGSSKTLSAEINGLEVPDDAD